jgi:hypothetical protein
MHFEDENAASRYNSDNNRHKISREGYIREALTARGFTTISAIANTPLVDFVAAIYDHLSDVEAARVHATATAQANLLNNMPTEVMVNSANDFPAQVDSQDLTRILPTLNVDSCQCQDCQNALSPLAYLTDLLDYYEKHLKSNNTPITLHFLSAGSNEAAKLVYCVGTSTKVL